jgi:hypothetical protein
MEWVSKEQSSDGTLAIKHEAGQRRKRTIMSFTAGFFNVKTF